MLAQRSLRHGDSGGHGFDAVPEVLKAEVFVGGVLVIVVIGDGDADGAGVCGSCDGVRWDSATGIWQKDDVAAGALDGFDDVGGDGQVDGSAEGGLGQTADPPLRCASVGMTRLNF